jgi:hypothetical protein
VKSVDTARLLDHRPRVTVSGSFHRHLASIQDDVASFLDVGLEVLSPADPRLVDAFGDFVFVASDRVRTLRVVQQRHFEAIRQSEFLWLVCPDGYVGASAAMEVGVAVSEGVPVVAMAPPNDQTLRQFVRVVRSLADALKYVSNAGEGDGGPTVLLDPGAAVEDAHFQLERIELVLTRGDEVHRLNDPRLSAAAAKVRQALTGL